jgi:hypothetical protein
MPRGVSLPSRRAFPATVALLRTLGGLHIASHPESRFMAHFSLPDWLQQPVGTGPTHSNASFQPPLQPPATQPAASLVVRGVTRIVRERGRARRRGLVTVEATTLTLLDSRSRIAHFSFTVR